MARDKKRVITSDGIDRREVGYYSTPAVVSEYIFDRLTEIKPDGSYLMDPCVGKGEMVKSFVEYGVEVDGLDIIKHKEYKDINFTKKDFIRLYREKKEKIIMRRHISDKYDYYVANPPYNCHEVNYIRENKEELKSLFPDVGTLNMYSMFISALIDFAKPGSVIGIITYDSFLNARGYEELRRKILNKTSIHDIILCPTDLFIRQGADVRTCILILQKGTNHQGSVRLMNRPTSRDIFEENIEKDNLEVCSKKDIVLNHKKDRLEIIVDVPDKVKGIFKNERIGDKFDCITGISTGNDSKYLSSSKTENHKIPFYKNPASKKFYMEPDAYLWENYLEESRRVDNFMVRNESLLKESGIACSSMGVEFGACRLPSEGLFGVNPNIICDDKDIWWMLSYMNSDLVQYFVRGVLRRSNMVTSGYVSRIPLVDFTDEGIGELDRLGKKGHNYASKGKSIEQIIERINNLVYKEAGLKGSGAEQHVDRFCSEVVKKS